MRVSIYSIQNTLYEGDAEKLIATTPMGEIAILENHLPIISKITGPHVTAVDSKGEKHIIELASGTLEVRPVSSGESTGSHAIILAEEGVL